MADNNNLQSAAPATLPAGTGIAFRSVTYSGDANQAIAPAGLVTFSGSDDSKTATDVTTSNPLPVRSVAATATKANVAESASSVTLIASNTARLGWSVYNDSDAALNLNFTDAASASAFVIRLLPRAFTSARDFGQVVFTGVITGIWDSTPGTSGHAAARVTELAA